MSRAATKTKTSSPLPRRKMANCSSALRRCLGSAAVIILTLSNFSDILLRGHSEEAAANRQLRPFSTTHYHHTIDNTASEVYFLNSTQLSEDDGLAASWLQTRDDFMAMDFEAIQTCEDAYFRAYEYGKDREYKMKMTLDWMDFSVEHMSQWWKTLDWDLGEDNAIIPHEKITTQLATYIGAATAFLDQQQPRPVFQRTIAVIAFQAFHNENNASMAYDLALKSLSATVESLRRAGFGRVTVGMLDAGDIDIVEGAFSYLRKKYVVGGKPQQHDWNTTTTTVGHMEVGYALVSPDAARTKFDGYKNVPRAVLLGLRDAFLYAAEESQIDERKEWVVSSWLGDKEDPSHWKYVYLTEPDSILQTRPSTLAALKAELDKGSVLLPHRLQPIPHESDVGDFEKPKQFVPSVLKQVRMELDPNNNHDACCDEDAGPDFKPGRASKFADCGNFWWACGFMPAVEGQPNRHERLQPYDFVRLMTGTQIVTIAGSAHGRRCIPKKKSICRPTS